MAARTQSMWSALNDQVGAEYTFDDVTLIISTVSVWNYTSSPYQFELVKRSDGSLLVILGSSTLSLPANTPSTGSPNKTTIDVTSLSAQIGLMTTATDKQGDTVFLPPYVWQSV